MARSLPSLGIAWGGSSSNSKRRLHGSSAALPPPPPGGGAGGAADAAAAASWPGSLADAVAAASPIERWGDTGAFDPITFGTSLWELAHGATGLPWWATIPAATLALRAALLPLTLKARAATLNFALLREADATSRALWERLESEQQAAAAASTSGRSSDSSTSSTSSSIANSGAAGGGKPLTRAQLRRRYLEYMRRHHGAPSLWWYTGNALVQVNAFLAMSAALRQMSAVGWPGLEAGGVGWFADLTRPAVEWGTWATAHGVAGAALPLAVFATYVRTLEYTSIGERS